METQRELPKKYKKEFSHSYTLGPFPTFELLLCRPESAEAVYFEESFTERGKLSEACRAAGVPCICSKRALERISSKENCYAAGVFRKYEGRLSPTCPMWRWYALPTWETWGRFCARCGASASGIWLWWEMGRTCGIPRW